MKIDIYKFQKDLKIRFKKKSLLMQALTHKSADQKNNNEKLEFLGDRVIGLVLSKKLFDLYPKQQRMKKSVVISNNSPTIIYLLCPGNAQVPRFQQQPKKKRKVK